VTTIINGLAEVADRYDSILCDIWGVVHNGRAAFPQAVDALVQFRARGGRVVLITNAPRPKDVIFPQLDRLGVPRDAYDDIVTSGDATRAELALRAPGPFFKLGPDKDLGLWEDLTLNFTALEDARFIACTGLVDDLTETPDDYHDLLARAAALGLDMICANPDIVVQFGDRLIYCAGALAELYERLGGRVVMAGKPFAAIYRLAFGRLAELAGPIEPGRVLAVGDGVKTDVKGAAQAGLDCLFVATGIHGDDVLGPDGLDPARIDAALSREQVRAAWSATGLAW
jgi:HAD superfamily hydrolase (TIGR01459 family)